jgi:hypothetical protein
VDQREVSWGAPHAERGTRAGIFAALLDDDERAFQQQVLAGSQTPMSQVHIRNWRADRELH